MFNNHFMTVLTDYQQTYTMDPSQNLVASISVDVTPDNPVVKYAGILVPPTDMLMSWVDGNILIMQNQYPYYLATKECDDLITALLAALCVKNVYLYMPQESFNIFGQALLDYLYYNYGIQISPNGFNVDQSKVPYIMSKFYALGLMDVNEYLDAYPGMYSLPDFVIQKLTIDLDPFQGIPKSFEECKSYFNQLLASKLLNQPKKQMVHIVR